MSQPPVCDYEGSDYQSSFWDQGEREYEDRVEAIALKRLLPVRGRLLLELGAGAGRNTPRYAGFDCIVLVDYSRSQLQQAQRRLGTSDRYVFVAADIYRLPFIAGVFDTATMIRTLHHMADAPQALAQVRSALAPHATFILEYANKRNSKAILRYLFGRQTWNPFNPEPVEFARLNFDFHPRTVRRWLEALSFEVERTLTVSHFRAGLLKRTVPTSVLVSLDSLFQPTGALWQLTPSVFVRAVLPGDSPAVEIPESHALFKCPECGQAPLIQDGHLMRCPKCNRSYLEEDGIYDFRRPASG
ncbi:MAG TPA: methyltransferase domain-containing protein [Anaerolineales bacterium]|nr:methyltransferase domain-containing protein [Anaerolineales bacterium]